MKWINLFILSLSVLFVALAIEAKANPGDPPTGGAAPYQPPVWVPDFQTPGFWEDLFTCKVCSEGYFEGTQCFPTSAKSSCGGTISYCTSKSTSFSAEIECEGLKAGIEHTIGKVICKECPVPQCDQVQILACYPNAKVRIWKCEREMCINLVPGPFPGTFICTEWRTESFITADFTSGGEPSLDCSDSDNSCHCKNLGKDCPCEDEEEEIIPDDPGETEPVECPDCTYGIPEEPGIDSDQQHNEWIGEPLAEGEWTNSITFDTQQFLDIASGTTPANSLDDITPYHLNLLLYIISKRQADPDYEAGTQFVVRFPNGGLTNGRAEDMVIVLESLRDNLLINPWLADLNRDGIIDEDDLNLLLDAMELATDGEPVSAWFDLNGDGMIDADDLVVWQLMHDSISVGP